MIRTGHYSAVVLIFCVLSSWSARAAQEPRRIDKVDAGTPEAIVKSALLAGLDADEPAGFERYRALMHRDRVRTKTAVEQLRRYSWKRFRLQVSDYVLAGTEGGFEVARMDPVKLDAATRFVRIFVTPVNNPKRTMPTPMRLERVGKKWFITANSL